MQNLFLTPSVVDKKYSTELVFNYIFLSFNYFKFDKLG